MGSFLLDFAAGKMSDRRKAEEHVFQFPEISEISRKRFIFKSELKCLTRIWEAQKKNNKTEKDPFQPPTPVVLAPRHKSKAHGCIPIVSSHTD